MATSGRRLVLGKIVGLTESERTRLEIRAGRWMGRNGETPAECAVVVQQRRRGEFGYGRPFKLVIEADELAAVTEGLSAWHKLMASARLSECFPKAGATNVA